MKFSLRNILIGVVCIVVANLLLVALRTVVAVPFTETVQSMVATGIGVIVWFLVVARLRP